MDERERLKTEFSRRRDRVKIGARILFLGLGLEIIVLLAFAKDKPWCETASFILSVIVVIVGIWIENVAGDQAEDVGVELQRLSDEEIARSTARSDEANQKAADAEARASEANQKAEEARLELAKYRASRVLTTEQIDRIAGKLRQFPSTRYDAAISAKEPEIIELFESIHAALEKAKWAGYPWGAKSQREMCCGMSIGVGLPLRDVAVGVHTTAWVHSGLQEVAQLLADELTAAGIPNVSIRQFADQFGTFEGMSFSTAEIHILIGRRT
jgi:hypothetical protein